MQPKNGRNGPVAPAGFSYTTIDRERYKLGCATATHDELFRVLAYAQAHRNRYAPPATGEKPRSKSTARIAHELQMSVSAAKEGLWYWGFLEALRDAEATREKRPKEFVRFAPKPARPKFNPHGWTE